MNLTNWVFKRKRLKSVFKFLGPFQLISLFNTKTSTLSNIVWVFSEIITGFQNTFRWGQFWSFWRFSSFPMNLNFFIFFISKKETKFIKINTFNEKTRKNKPKIQSSPLGRKIFFSFLKNFFLNRTRNALLNLKFMSLFSFKEIIPCEIFSHFENFLFRVSNSKTKFVFFYWNIENSILKISGTDRILYFLSISFPYDFKNYKKFFKVFSIVKKIEQPPSVLKEFTKKKKKNPLFGLTSSLFFFFHRINVLSFRKIFYKIKNKSQQVSEIDTSESKGWISNMYFFYSFLNKDFLYKEINILLNQFKEKKNTKNLKFRNWFLRKILFFCIQDEKKFDLFISLIRYLCKKDNRFIFFIKKELRMIWKSTFISPKYFSNISKLIILLLCDKIIFPFFFFRLLNQNSNQLSKNFNSYIENNKKFLKGRGLSDSIFQKIKFEKRVQFIKKSNSDFSNLGRISLEIFTSYFSVKNFVKLNLDQELFLNFLSMEKEYRC